MKILVVEDEHRIANTIKKGLEQEHFIVDVAFNGSEGYDLAVTEDYDLLILDLMLPDLDGIEICRKLRQKQNHVPIILLTAKSQIKDKVEGLDSGADDYLTKPFSFEELLARIRALARRPKITQTVKLIVADLSLDSKSFQVVRNGIKINLSQKEFILLEYLMRNANSIISKEQIISHVWDYDAEILPNTIEVYIKNLRTKIDKPFFGNVPLIHTVRGFGYKIGR